MSDIYLCVCGHQLHQGKKCGNRSVGGTSIIECQCQAADQNARYYMDVCTDCGARVGNQTRHDYFHERLDAIEREANEYKYPPLIGGIG